MRLEDLRREQMLYVRKKKKRLRIARTFILLILVSAIIAVNMRQNLRFETTTYQITSDRVQNQFRIALLSDLHNHEYGENNYDLVEAIRQSRPDLILMAGDMLNADDHDLHVVLNLCENLKRVAPICYMLGNHEGTLMYAQEDGKVDLDGQLIRMGVRMLYHGPESIVVRGNPVTLGPFSYQSENAGRVDMAQVAQLEESEGFRIVASHYPSIFYEKLYDVDAELAVAGHYHGGQVRLPLLGGLYHVDDGLFPRYSGGKYKLGRAELVVSRGLGGHTSFPRINNRPELVLIDVVPSGGGQER